MNSQTQQEIDRLPDSIIIRMKADYYQGVGLTLWDIAFKYNVTFATACYIIKASN